MIFVSYSSKDLTAARKTVQYLEGRGISCWYAERDIVGGTAYPARIMQAIRECGGFVLIASDHINQSQHISSEVALAFDQKKTIYPLLIDRVRFSDEYLYFLNRIQWINAYDSLEDGLETLVRVITRREAPAFRTPVPAAEPQPGPPASLPQVRIATYQDLISLGMTPLDIARRLVENDYKLYPDLPVANEGGPEQWAGYLSSYPDTFRYLINRKNEIVGNWSFLAVSEAVHAEKLASGELTESSFRLDETEYLLFPGDYIGYLLNLSLNDGYGSPDHLNLLLESLVQQLITFADSGIYFKAWYVNVFRKDHESMYRRLGFSYLLDNVSFGKLYWMSCIPPAREPQRKTRSDNPVFLAGKKLMEMYYDHFVQES